MSESEFLDEPAPRTPLLTRPWVVLLLKCAVLFTAVGCVIALAAYMPLLASNYNTKPFKDGLKLILATGAGVAVVLLIPRLGTHTVKRLAGFALTALFVYGVGRFGLNVDDPAAILRERMHILMYGGFAALVIGLCRAEDRDLSCYIYGLLAATGLAFVDEGVQWLLPTRVGTLADVKLDVLSALVGVMYMALVVDVGRARWQLKAISSSKLLYGCALLTVLAAIFIDRVHLGYSIDHPSIGSFASRHDAHALLEKSRSWSPQPVIEKPAWKAVWRREDFYASEARYHISARNNLLVGLQPIEALKEQWILEVYYASYLAHHPRHELTDEQRSKLFADAGQGVEAYPYKSGPPQLMTWVPRMALFLAGCLLTTLLILWAELMRLRQ